MVGYPIENWSANRRDTVVRWLNDTFGKEDYNVWYIDYDFNLHTLCLSDEALLVVLLKFDFLIAPPSL